MKLTHAALALALVLSACAGLTQPRQKIGAACESSATAMEVITAGLKAGRITKADHAKALKVYATTVPYCEPVAASLSASDYAALAAANATLLTASRSLP